MTVEKTQDINWIDFAYGLSNIPEPTIGNTTSTPVNRARLKNYVTPVKKRFK